MARACRERVAVGRPAVSKHLKVLQGAGLVSHHSVGTRNLYALAPEGYAVAQRWFADTWTAALTAFARSDDRRRAISAGFHMHLAKPVEPAELVTVVASLARR